MKPRIEGGERPRAPWWAWLAILVVWAAVSLPLATGGRTLLLRDVFTTHLPYKAFGAEQLREGRIPALNPTVGLGQPFRGNPNALPFYPGNVLYLILPFWSAFNLHYALHWLLALLTMRSLARELGQSRGAALLAGLTYAGSGWLLSCLTFYNLLTVSAWWPLVLLGVARGGRRGVALGGLACGLALLGGDPGLATLGLVPAVVLAIERHGARRGLGTVTAIGAAGLLLALPQVVATMRVLPDTTRGGPGLLPQGLGVYALHPLRLLELILPLPFGWPSDVGRFRFWADGLAPRLPFIFSLYGGAIGLWLALTSHRRLWLLVAAGGAFLAWVAGLFPAALGLVTGGLMRHPEKVLFWFALAMPMLAGWGLDRLWSRPDGSSRRLGGAAVAALSGALGLILLAPLLADRLSRWTDEAQVPGTAINQVASWAAAAVVLAVVLALAAIAVHRRSAGALIVLQVACLLQLFPLLPTDATEPYRERSAWSRRVGLGAAVVKPVERHPFGEEPPAYELPDTSVASRERVEALNLDPVPGVLQGLTYPLAPDLDGMHSPGFTALLQRLPSMSWQERIRWLQSLGAGAVVLFGTADRPGFELVERADRFGVAAGLYRVPGAAPAAWWPDHLVVARGPEQAFKFVGNLADPVRRVVVPTDLDHLPGGRVRVVEETADRLQLEVESPGGLVVVRRAFQPILRARAGGRKLDTLPVNFCLLGVLVPPGAQQIEISVSWWPVAVATMLAAVGWVAALWVVAASSRRRTSA